MARVTVEDCLKNVKNRFELVLIAAKRARQLMRGKDAKVEWDNDKATVVALREIAAGYTDIDVTDDHAPQPAVHAASLPPIIDDHLDDEDEDLDDAPQAAPSEEHPETHDEAKDEE